MAGPDGRFVFPRPRSGWSPRWVVASVLAHALLLAVWVTTNAPRLVPERTQGPFLITAGIRELVAKAGKPKRVFESPAINQELYDQIAKQYRDELSDALNTAKYPKLESYARVDALRAKALESVAEG